MPVETGSNANAAATEPASLATLCEAERVALRERRRIVLGEEAVAKRPDELNLPRVGLALSGGGVRSATFALGLMRGLAQSSGTTNPGGGDPAQRTLASEGLLGRFDYLSSVSGGGYVAGMYGRLVSAFGLQGAQQRMARSDAPVLEWLRRNGRYLTPAGSRDIGIAIVTFLRSLLAIHFEFMFACLFLGLVVIGPHLWQHTVQVLKVPGWEPWLTPWWALATVWWLLVAPGLISGYWAAREAPEPRPGEAVVERAGWRCISLRDVLFVLISAAFTAAVLRSLYTNGALDPIGHAVTWPTAGALALVSLVFGQALVQAWLATRTEPRGLAVARLRNWLTRALRVVTSSALAIGGLGVLDRLSWWVLEELQTGNEWLWSGVGVGGIAVLVLRSLMQPLQQLAADPRHRGRDWLPRLLNLGSLLGMLALVLLWLVLLQWFVFAPTTFDAFIGVPAWMRAGVVAIVWAAWVLLTSGNAQMANTSSLHSFYRARLTRAYLAVGNLKRGLEDRSKRHADVTEVVEGDDTRMAGYHPETRGGPIHLVNTCLNQTRDDLSGLYNADRKGAAVTATWRGLEVGPDEFIPARPDYDAGSLGRWVAISGAAASPGAGSYTSRGLALLVYFLGVRLGFWLRAPRQRVRLRWLSELAWRVSPKPLMLASEASATFFGEERPWWYLSDGGHFENTGVYALLKRELDFIILSDASCDADYNFGDIENLVRKARIDFGAEIDFYTREEAASLFTLAGAELTVVSPEDMSDNHSCRGVMLARIRYRERAGPPRADGSPATLRPEGTLLVVKPNLHDALDVDLLSYARQHPAFPHESTGDQSFDEAQWESYHRLGEDFGRAVHESWLAQLPGWRRPARHGLKVAARLRRAADVPAGKSVATEPLWRRSARATAIGTTLGVGASGTLLISLWQVQDALQRRQSDEQSEVRQMFTEASKGLQAFDGACPNVPDHVVTQASRLFELRGSPALGALEQGGVDRIAERVTQECEKAPSDSASCQAAYERMHNDLCAQVVKQDVQGSALDYWRPGLSRADQTREAQQTWTQLSAFWKRAAPLGDDIQTAQSDAAEPAFEIPQIARSTAAPPPTAAEVPPPVPAAAVEPVEPVEPTAGAAAEPAPAAPAPAALPPEIAAMVGAEPPANAVLPRRLSAGAAVVKATCMRNGEPTRLFLLVYDDETSAAASQWRQRLLDQPGDLGLQVVPVRNVTRDAELRQQRHPVPWPKPTFVLHDLSSRGCAVVLGRQLRIVLPEGPPGDGADSRFWVRDLPESQPNRRPGVIELWLPPGSLVVPDGTAGASPSAR